MNAPSTPEGQGTSTRPYLIRALHDWCTDNGFTPYLAVYVDRSVQVPAEYVKNNEIVLNASFEATSGLQLGNEFISFKARFGGVAREIHVPVDHVTAYLETVQSPKCAKLGELPPGGGTPGVGASVAGEVVWPLDKELKRRGWSNVPPPALETEKYVAYVFRLSDTLPRARRAG